VRMDTKCMSCLMGLTIRFPRYVWRKCCQPAMRCLVRDFLPESLFFCLSLSPPLSPVASGTPFIGPVIQAVGRDIHPMVFALCSVSAVARRTKVLSRPTRKRMSLARTCVVLVSVASVMREPAPCWRHAWRKNWCGTRSIPMCWTYFSRIHKTFSVSAVLHEVVASPQTRKAQSCYRTTVLSRMS
jgi:hypothetical protein